MNITAAMVKELRETTGAGMMDCKKALTETEGDMAKAVEYLREKGLAAAAKKAEPHRRRGRCRRLRDATKCGTGAIVEVNCETDFVANTPDFKDFG